MKNKITLIILSMFLVIALIGCNSTSSTTDTNTGSNAKSNSTEDEVLPIDNTKNFEEATTSEGKNNTKTEKAIRIYLYDGVNDKIFYKTETVEVTDGALVTAIISSLKENRGENYCTLPADLGVRNAKLDSKNDQITVDFGEKFVNNMNLGSSAEIGVLQTIVNSIGYNFNVSKVYITVNGKNYSSGHIVKNAGEAFDVKYDNITELK
jgi:spore germination protein GerM